MDSTKMVTIDGQEYELEAIPEEVRNLIVLFSRAQEKLNDARNDLSIYDAACASYAGLISAKMKAYNESADAEIVSE